MLVYIVGGQVNSASFKPNGSVVRIPDPPVTFIVNSRSLLLGLLPHQSLCGSMLLQLFGHGYRPPSPHASLVGCSRLGHPPFIVLMHKTLRKLHCRNLHIVVFFI